MPELPEVETIKLGLEKKIIGLKIQKIQVISPKTFIGNSQEAEGQIVLKVWRRGKILGVDLSGNITLLFHLKMSGQLVLIQKSKIKNQNDKSKFKNEDKFIGGHPTEDMLGKMPNAHTRVIFTLQSQEKQKSRLLPLATSHLYFNDQRKFGWVKVVRSTILSERSESKDLGKLGPEPLEKGFTWQVLKQNLLKHKNWPIKVAIMDQTVVAGVGNIYANEACFDAKLDPRTKVSDLSDQQLHLLYRGIIKSLKDGIAHGGSTRAHFVDPQGHKGYFLDYALVYWRDKHPCKVCGTEIKKIALGGRGTYFCSGCQK
ncbi:bifunctional DNA-formamidopyrimidine glycosylase/DNA-(apurinic or apyrimidinic site) lyase [Candidatus Daviesbacteria bacterium]|nr:bifunctional DNA-formamidopyrimidine glycosylase/DNA-(apurinic or apyrimidinic site) lyase [Candidatus Daviesbacteria bacterium]